MAQQACIEPGCPNMAQPGPRHSRCRPHQLRWEAARNRRPERQAYNDPAYRAAVVAPTCCIPDCDQPSTKDHIIELHQGGTNDPSNLQPLCITHNVEKSNRERRRS